MSGPDDHRRKWDKDLYEKLAKEKKEEKDSLKEKVNDPVKRELLKPREHAIDFTSKLGKTQIISKTDPSQQGGYFCDLCQCLLKDSTAFLDHLNGKGHQRNQGMSMKVGRSTLTDVKNRFKMHKEKKEKEVEIKPYSYTERMRELEEEDEQIKAKQREKRLNKKRKAKFTEEIEDNEDISSQMGFGSFSSKKNKN